jgi:hypothetical protein
MNYQPKIPGTPLAKNMFAKNQQKPLIFLRVFNMFLPLFTAWCEFPEDFSAGWFLCRHRRMAKNPGPEAVSQMLPVFHGFSTVC